MHLFLTVICFECDLKKSYSVMATAHLDPAAHQITPLVLILIVSEVSTTPRIFKLHLSKLFPFLSFRPWLKRENFTCDQLWFSNFEKLIWFNEHSQCDRCFETTALRNESDKNTFCSINLVEVQIKKVTFVPSIHDNKAGTSGEALMMNFLERRLSTQPHVLPWKRSDQCTCHSR